MFSSINRFSNRVVPRHKSLSSQTDSFRKSAVEMSLSMNQIELTNRYNVEACQFNESYVGRLKNPNNEICMGQYAMDGVGTETATLYCGGVNECVALAIVMGNDRLLAHINVTQQFEDGCAHQDVTIPKAHELVPNPEKMVDEFLSKVSSHPGYPKNDYTVLIAGGEDCPIILDTVTELVLNKLSKHIKPFNESRVTVVFRPFNYIKDSCEPFVDVVINKERNITIVSPKFFTLNVILEKI